MNDRIARKSAAIATRIERGSTEGERAAARNVLGKLVRKHGLRACLPAHPLASTEIVCEWDLVDALDASWDRSRYANRSRWTSAEKAAAWAALPAWGAKTLGRACAILQARLANGWERGAWVGGDDLKYLNVTTWGLERAFREAAELEGWGADDATSYLQRTTSRMQEHLRAAA